MRYVLVAHIDVGTSVGEDLDADRLFSISVDLLLNFSGGEFPRWFRFASFLRAYRHNNDLPAEEVNLMLDLVRLKVPDLDDWPCKICLGHSRWHFYGKMDVIYGLNLTFLQEYDRVNDLRNNTKFDAAYQALKRIDPARCMYDAYHAHACEAHVGERPEVAGLANLVINRVVGPH